MDRVGALKDMRCKAFGIGTQALLWMMARGLPSGLCREHRSSLALWGIYLDTILFPKLLGLPQSTRTALPLPCSCTVFRELSPQRSLQGSEPSGGDESLGCCAQSLVGAAGQQLLFYLEDRSSRR